VTHFALAVAVKIARCDMW